MYDVCVVNEGAGVHVKIFKIHLTFNMHTSTVCFPFYGDTKICIPVYVKINLS